MMKMQRKLWMATAMASTLALAGCWGGGDDDDDNVTVTPPVASAEVPGSAGVGTAAFVSYLMSLGSSDESSEPLIIKDTFAVPADESAEPTPLT